MGRARRVNDFQIEEDPQFEVRLWRLQRYCWGVMVAVLVAALLGLLGGGGPLAHATARLDDGSLRLEYERFARREAATTLTFSLPVPRDPPGTVSIRLNRSFVEAAQLERVEPEPVRVVAGAGEIVYVVDAAEAARDGTVQIRVLARPTRAGTLSGQARRGTRPEPLRFQLFVYP